MSDISNQLATLSNNIDNQVSGALYQAYCLGRSKGKVETIDECLEAVEKFYSQQECERFLRELKEQSNE